MAAAAVAGTRAATINTGQLRTDATAAAASGATATVAAPARRRRDATMASWAAGTNPREHDAWPTLPNDR